MVDSVGAERSHAGPPSLPLAEGFDGIESFDEGTESFAEDSICGTGGSKAWPLVTGPWSSTGIVTFAPGNGGNPPVMRITCSCSDVPELICLICNSSR